MVSTPFIIGAALKIVGACGVGLTASHLLKALHKYEFKFKKKGDNNERYDGEYLRERAKGIR